MLSFFGNLSLGLLINIMLTKKCNKRRKRGRERQINVNVNVTLGKYGR